MTDIEFLTTGDLVDRLAKCILKETNFQIIRLEIVPINGRVSVSGRVTSFYQKQLALQAAIKCLGAQIGLAEFEISVGNAEVGDPSEAMITTISPTRTDDVVWISESRNREDLALDAVPA